MAEPALDPRISRTLGITSASWFDLRLDADAVHFGVPSTTATIVVAFDEPTDTGWVGEAEHRGYRVLVAGLHTRPSLVRTHGRQCGMQLALTPAGARVLLGMPIGELAGRIVELEALGSAALRPAIDRVLGATDGERQRVFARAVTTLVERRGAEAGGSAADRGPAPEVREAWRLVTAGGGRLDVDAIAHRVGWSRRHLTARFVTEYGVAPKQVSRVARFCSARALADGGTPLAEVAARTGYSDQSHLTREWRAIAGRPPARALETDFPNLQDASPPPVGG